MADNPLQPAEPRSFCDRLANWMVLAAIAMFYSSLLLIFSEHLFVAPAVPVNAALAPWIAAAYPAIAAVFAMYGAAVCISLMKPHKGSIADFTPFICTCYLSILLLALANRHQQAAYIPAFWAACGMAYISGGRLCARALARP